MVPIDSQWAFEDVLVRVFSHYSGSGQMSTEKRNNILKAWGSVVGREQAVADFGKFVDSQGGLQNTTNFLGLSVGTLRSIRRHFQQVQHRNFLKAPRFEKRSFQLGATVNFVDEYAVAHLNSEGGSIF